MDLLPGVRVRDLTGRLAERVALSEGLRVADPVEGEVRFMEGAILPRGAFRAPTTKEIALLEARGRPSSSRGVGGLRPRTPFVVTILRGEGILDSALRRDACAGAATAETWADYVTSEACTLEMASAAERFAAPYHRGGEDDPVVTFSLTRKEPGLLSLAFDRSIGEHVGLHFDNYDRLPVGERHRARNRLVFNLGTSERQLFLVNLPLMRVRAMLPPPEGIMIQNWSEYLRVAFVRRFPDYPVVRVRLEPGEAYIASTDHLIHDGSTALTVAPDVSLHFLGRFTA